jgi:hypothetical protein
VPGTGPAPSLRGGGGGVVYCDFRSWAWEARVSTQGPWAIRLIADLGSAIGR